MKSSLKKSPKQRLVTGSHESSSPGAAVKADSGKKFSGGGHKFGSGKIDTKGPMKYGGK